MKKSKKVKSVESLDKVSKTKRRRREKSLSVDREGKVKRTKSTSRDSSIGREVRCACQYYMSDNLLPERVSLFGSRSPSRASNLNMAQNIGDHEYEPINPPPPLTLAKDEDGKLNKSVSESSIPEKERRLLRIPLDTELVVTNEGEEEKEEDLEVEQMTAQDIQDDIENRYLSATPTTTVTTQSRTECDVNTSMLDSSGLEDLPLKKGARSRKAIQTKTEQMRAHAQGLQSRIKSQAGKLRSKLRNIPRPNFNIKDRPKSNSPEKTKFKLPERPKFNLPDRSKFKFPDRPKINLPSFSKSRPLRERQEASGTRKNLFDFEFSKTYPKIFNKKSKKRGDYATSSPKQTRGCTPPPRMASGEPVIPERKKGPIGQRWVNRFDDIKYADENGESVKDRESRISSLSESISDFKDKNFGYTQEDLDEVKLPPGRRTISTKSSLSHLSDREVQSSNSSEDKHRQGVIEEIDSDQFFLRQKGISQDDVNMEKYLSEEIREAFKSPVVNALAQMDYDYEVEEPLKPDRTRSLKRSKQQSQEEVNEENRFKTYPPNRPIRRSSTKSKTTLNQRSFDTESVGEDNQKPTARYENTSRYENVDVDESDYYKTPTSHYQVPNPEPTPIKRRHSAKEYKKDGAWVEVEIETSIEEVEREKPPEKQKRRKSRKDLDEKSVAEAENIRQKSVPETEHASSQIEEPDYIIPRAPEEIQLQPVPPKRSRSRGSRSLHSLVLEDNKSRKSEPKEVIQTPEEKFEQQIEQIIQVQAEVHQEDPLNLSLDDSVGYATIGKPIVDKPERSKRPKPPRPPPPRKKRSISPQFNTLPARLPKPQVPTRPTRYSTLGPSRPPRRRTQSSGSIEHIYSDDMQSQTYLEIQDSLKPEDKNELHSSNKDLQKEEVIEKMKIRPLPAPPRPPRHRRDDQDDLSEDAKVSLALLRGEDSIDMVEEVSIAIQTDPVSEDFDIDYEDESISQELSHEEKKNQDIFLGQLQEEERKLMEKAEELRKQEVFKLQQAEEEQRKIEEQKEKEKKEEELKVRLLEDELNKEKNEQQRLIEEEKRALENKLRLEEERKEKDKLEELKRLQEEKQRLEQEKLRLEQEQRRIQEEKIKFEEMKVLEEQEKKKAEQLRLEELRRQEEIIQKQREEEIRKVEEQFARLREEERKSETEQQEVARALEPRAERPSRRADDRRVKSLIEPIEDDPGYASLDRRGKREEPVPVYIPVKPDLNSTVEVLKTERLKIEELDVTRLRVTDLQAANIHVENLTGNQLTLGNINSETGNLTLRNIELPPNFIEQILARIPWEEIRPSLPSTDSSPPELVHPRGTRKQRRHKQTRYSSDDEEANTSLLTVQRRHRAVAEVNPIELSRQLARACTAAGFRAIRRCTGYISSHSELTEEKRKNLQIILCVVLILIAMFILFNMDRNGEQVHHWDFQFPPQVPPHG